MWIELEVVQSSYDSYREVVVPHKLGILDVAMDPTRVPV